MLLLTPSPGVNVAAKHCGDLAGRPEPLTRAAQPCRSGGRMHSGGSPGRPAPQGSCRSHRAPGLPTPSVGFLVCCRKLVIQHSLALQERLLLLCMLFAHERERVQPLPTPPPLWTSPGCTDLRVTLPGLCPGSDFPQVQPRAGDLVRCVWASLAPRWGEQPLQVAVRMK